MDLIGHTITKQRISMALSAARQRNSSAPHMLFTGHPGCGKTSMAEYVAKTSGCDFLACSPTELINKKIVLEICEKLNHNGYNSTGDRVGDIKPTILFIDEIHRMPIKGQEIIGIIMERFVCESDEPNSYYWLPFFTLIGATTEEGTLSKPFLDRFSIILPFNTYELEEMEKIVYVHLLNEKVFFDQSIVPEIAKRSRGVPRIANNIVKNIRDYQICHNKDLITYEDINIIFNILNIDTIGLDEKDRKLLIYLMESKKPVGLETLSIVLNVDIKTVSKKIEPYLMRLGFMVKGVGGRVITQRGIDHITGGSLDAKDKKVLISHSYRRL